MKTLALVLAVAAAGCPDDDTIFPINTPSTNNSARAFVLNGTVCVLVDAQVLGTCAVTTAGGLTITVSNTTTITRTDGTFTIITPTPITPTDVITVTGPTIVTSTLPLVTPVPTTGNLVVPVITQQLFGNLVLSTGITLTQGTGSILTSVVTRGGIPISNVFGTSTPSPAFGPFFDGTTPSAWQLNATGARGIVFLPGVNVGPSSLTLTDLSTAGETTIDGIQVVNGGFTFVDAVLP